MQYTHFLLEIDYLHCWNKLYINILVNSLVDYIIDAPHDDFLTLHHEKVLSKVWKACSI